VETTQSNGLFGLESNTVLIGLPKTPEPLGDLLEIVPSLSHLNKSVIIGKAKVGTYPVQGRQRSIHVWWGGLERNGDLMLLLAHLLTRNGQWRGAEIHIFSIASNELKKSETENQLSKLLPEARIDATTNVLVKQKDESIRQIIQRESADADIVFLGLATPSEDQVAQYAERMFALAEPFPTVFFVKNSSLFVGELVG
jgi:hypothetical protein